MVRGAWGGRLPCGCKTSRPGTPVERAVNSGPRPLSPLRAGARPGATPGVRPWTSAKTQALSSQRMHWADLERAPNSGAAAPFRHTAPPGRPRGGPG